MKQMNYSTSLKKGISFQVEKQNKTKQNQPIKQTKRKKSIVLQLAAYHDSMD